MDHEFVEFIPSEMEEGVLYVSLMYCIAAHKCCCGCGRDVFTPLSPADWTLIFDGATVSLHPSIGNWNLACKSHYWIRNGKVEWAARWSEDRIARARRRDRRERTEYYDCANLSVRSGRDPMLTLRGEGGSERKSRCGVKLMQIAGRLMGIFSAKLRPRD